MVTEVIPLSSEYFNVMNGSEGRTLKHIEEVSGAKITLGKMKNGLTGFTSTGEKFIILNIIIFSSRRFVID